MRNAGRIHDNKSKGNIGEDVVFALLAKRYPPFLLYHSLEYPYQTDRSGNVYLGNIKYDADQKRFYSVSGADYPDEVDVVLITPYRFLLIEVKSYRSSYFDCYEHWCNVHNGPCDKSPVTQGEKHARHFYHFMNSVIPDGDPNYIVPIVCLVDNIVLRDDRVDYWQIKYPVCILDDLIPTINKVDTPLDYNLDLKSINRFVHKKATSIKKEMIREDFPTD